MSDNKTSSNGIGFTGALLIAFIVLKLCNVIDWSWWWVLSPAWITVGLALIGLGLLGLSKMLDKKDEKKVVNKNGEIKSKWEQRLEEVQNAKRQRENQQALDDIMKRSKSDEFRAQNKL